MFSDVTRHERELLVIGFELEEHPAGSVTDTGVSDACVGGLHLFIADKAVHVCSFQRATYLIIARQTQNRSVGSGLWIMTSGPCMFEITHY
jgi:hypothetical protein